MSSDFKDLVRILSDQKAKFLIIGGFAVIKYTEPRYTKHIDILVGSNSENAQKVFQSLALFGAPLQGITIEDFSTPGVFFQVGVAPNRVDVIVEVPGVDFDDAYGKREEVLVDDVVVPFIGLEDLIQAKLASGRPQDLVDAGSLTKVKLKRGKKK